MNRKSFVQLAGGVYKSRVRYEHWASADKEANFWDFFDHCLEAQRSIYGGIDVKTLLTTDKESIEHIVPRTWLHSQLIKQRKSIRYGATVNPFNFAPSHRRLNSARSSFPFDFDGDPVTKRSRVHVEGGEMWETGLDYQKEWVVPLHSRGFAARSMIYMGLVYQLKFIEREDIPSLITWLFDDPPTYEEMRYNDWIDTRLGIRNPLLDRSYVCASFHWFKNHDLLNSLVLSQID
jgi:hypothetical protein